MVSNIIPDRIAQRAALFSLGFLIEPAKEALNVKMMMEMFAFTL